MLMPVSADFIALCRWQLSLLAQGFHAEQSTVYLAEEWQESGPTALHPIVRYPDVADPARFGSGELLRLEPETGITPIASLPDGLPPGLKISEQMSGQVLGQDFLPALTPTVTDNASANYTSANHASANWVMPAPPAASRRIVLPLIHEKLVLGLLTVERPTPVWNDWEQAQIEKIAHTLAISCFLDQQNQWLLQQPAPAGDAALDTAWVNRQETLDTLLHQLKSPITAIRTFGKLILKRLKPQDDRRAVDGILQETDHVQELLQEVQQVLKGAEAASRSPLSSGTLQITSSPNSPASLPPSVALNLPPALDAALPTHPSPPLLPSATFLTALSLEPCQVTDVIAQPLATATAIAQERDLQMQVEIASPLPLVIVDTKGLREVVTNIVDNALKYTPAGGRISILVFCDRNGQYNPDSAQAGVAIAVSDTGLGIPPADQARLFERNYRGEKAQGSIPGTGLGLAIARELMIKMHGNVYYWSPRCPELVVPGFDESPAGSTFLIWIPIASNLQST